ncbi:hypothetical protein HELRODRAFT_183459 [Helobdella robusta]|uniref:Uncharacterized protein n=1 Tax=Helobdella robusta TaxID=6412 RepID=T1FJP8_HELRO|nr:hypothetical protein HELRODRAFT_183459 [Helobdella robusta]ESO11144.1 hypothetical protein HELRODRAFT_183459 [Helobdella robusta]
MIVCIGFIVLLIVLGVVRIRSIQLGEDAEKGVEDPELNIILNPMHPDNDINECMEENNKNNNNNNSSNGKNNNKTNGTCKHRKKKNNNSGNGNDEEDDDVINEDSDDDDDDDDDESFGCHDAAWKNAAVLL